MPLDFGQTNDEQVVYQFLMENAVDHPIIINRAEQMKFLLSEFLPERPPEQDIVGSLLCADMKIDDVTQSKLGIDAKAMIDEWNSSMFYYF